MKLLKLAVVTSALSLSGMAMADSQIVRSGNVFEANQLIPSGVRAEVGTTGYGGALLWTVNPYVGLALGYNGGDISWRDDVSVNGTKYDLDMENKTAYLNAELRPWGASENAFAKSIYVAAGVGYLDNDYDLQKRTSSGRTLTVDGNDYQVIDASRDGGVNGKMSYKNDIAPYVGLGIAPKINKNFGLFGEVGAYYTGNPTVDLNHYNLTAVSGAQDIETNVRNEEDKIRNDSKYEWMPVGKVGVSFHW